jgi:hypothetical protein
VQLLFLCQPCLQLPKYPDTMGLDLQHISAQGKQDRQQENGFGDVWSWRDGLF